MYLYLQPNHRRKLALVLYGLLLLLTYTYNCSSAQAQTKYPWDAGFKWPWENSPPPTQTPPPVTPSWRSTLLQRAKQKAEAEKKRQEEMQKYINQGICPPIQTANPAQSGKSNEWKNFTNSLGRTDSTSGHMRGYNGNQAYMGPGRAGTYVDGGSTTTSIADTLNQSNYHGPTGPAPQTNMSGQDFANAIGGRMAGP